MAGRRAGESGGSACGPAALSLYNANRSRTARYIDYPIIETFDHDEGALQQITCVPFYTFTHYQEMSEAELAALPASWCLMRDADLLKAGWVAQRAGAHPGIEKIARRYTGDPPSVWTMTIKIRPCRQWQ